MSDIINHSALNTALAVGHKTGLLQTMIELTRPHTIDEIATKASLSSRYVKEWLGAMTVSDIVSITDTDGDGTEPTYFLPREHVSALQGMGVYTQEIPLLSGPSLNKVVKAFSTGEGVTYDNYTDFCAWMGELSQQKHHRVLVQEFIPSVQDGAMLQMLQEGIHVCDLGCGEGVVVQLLAEAFPKSTFVGLDIDQIGLEKATQAALSKGLKNVEYKIQNCSAAVDGDLVGKFDYVLAFDSIHDQTKPDVALKVVHTLLKPGGKFSMIDIRSESTHKANKSLGFAPLLYTVSMLHCMPVGLVEGGAGLGTMWGREVAVAMLNQAGFSKVEVLDMAFDTFNYHYFAEK
eukprot:TRINITY_DN27635_c0_g1_i1.p1 TRINITY_DN27635_c0_g1~~TRINITY_DN27635_c0_g1_i1.p1  ORF type:complete len:378 (-),score=53.91 TRINITY_DN27635_c0_g1_i1:13-1050(-)